MSKRTKRKSDAQCKGSVAGRDATTDNLIDVHIARLRRKLDDPFGVKLLKTVRGVGFVLTENEA